MGWKSKTDRAKKQHRPSLRDWACDNLHASFPSYRDQVLQLSHTDVSHSYQAFLPFGKTPRQDYHTYNAKDHKDGNDNDTVKKSSPQETAGTPIIPLRMDARRVPPSTFHSDYEARGIPTVITHVPQGCDIPPPPGCDRDSYKRNAWKALTEWDWDELGQSVLRERTFKCGEDDNGKSIRIKLKHFLRYVQQNEDDSPLYIFDSAYDDDRVSRCLLTHYRVPSYFSEDLFRLVGEKRRPPYRWFLIGPQRSGTCVHIDPLATSAWNTLIKGQKRWILFPPHVPKSVVKGKGLVRKEEDDEAIHYFMTIVPRIKQAALACGNTGKYKDFECFEFTQEEGETVFIPNGWWHAVLNLTDTIGVTQNFCSSRNFNQVWRKTRSGRKKMCWKWYMQLKIYYPHLAQRAEEMNAKDDFAMKYDPKEVAKRNRQEEERRRLKRQEKMKKEGIYDANNAGNGRMYTSNTEIDRNAKRSRVERVVTPPC